MWTESLRVRFRDCDPAGILFNSQTQAIAHDVYENWILDKVSNYGDWFDNPQFAIPLRAAKVDYLRPLKAGDEFEAQLVVETLGSTSFQLNCRFLKGQHLCSEIQTTHVFLDKESGAAMPIPEELRVKLAAFQPQDLSS